MTLRIDDYRLYCYLPGLVLRDALKEPRVLDALLDTTNSKCPASREP